MLKVLFIDRDGTLIEEPDDYQVDALSKVRLVPGVIAALQSLKEMGYRFVVVSNQDGLGSPSFAEDAFTACNDHMLHIFESQGISFDEIFICPHLAEDNCDCRKPRAGLLTRYLSSHNLDLSSCAVIGDRETDLQLADAIGVKGFQLGIDEPSMSWSDVRVALTPGQRTATSQRTTRETSVDVSVNLDAATPLNINTGIGFYDHMLEQVAKHGGFSLVVQCNGDLVVDEHHTVEDTALTMGIALRKALGNKLGVTRYGFQLPMDESEARVSLDLSGRPLLVFDGEFPRDTVGEMPTELVPHFFQSLADSLGATLHIAVKGANTHHMVESCFKALGRALRQAIRTEGVEVPSTKGLLT